MKRNLIILSFCLLCSWLCSCGPRVHKTYKYTISGTIYADRQNMTPLANKKVYISDVRENDYTYGSSTISADYRTQTNEDGYFSITINGGKILTTVSIGGCYDVRGDSLVLDADELHKHYYYEEDTCWHTEYLYYKETQNNDIDTLQNLVIFLDEYPTLTVEPNSFRRNQTIRIISDVGLYYAHFFCLEDLFYNRNWREDSLPSARKWLYEYEFGNSSVPFNKTMDINLAIPDSVPAGYYRFRLFGNAYIFGSSEPDCIVQIVDDPIAE